MKYQLIKYYFLFLLSSFGVVMVNAQDSIPTNTLSYEEFMGYLKAHHPLVKQANLKLSLGEANLLKSRGGFDPKISVDYDRKKFKETEYYDILNTTFKIPTWYGIEFKANYENNTGAFLNPSLTVPEDGLYSAGVSFSVLQGFLMNDRMATLKKAKHFVDQTTAERDLMINTLLYEASLAYFNWIEAYNEQKIYASFIENADFRLQAIKRSIEVGDLAPIDSTEAKIILQSRLLGLENAMLNTRKAALKASNFIWINDVPVELKDDIIPENPTDEILESSLLAEDMYNNNELLDSHPKLRALDAKLNVLNVDRALKANKLLPKLDLEYNFLNTEFDDFDNYMTSNYKAGVNFSLPLFLRKERGDLKLAKIKIAETEFERTSEAVSIQNKITAIQNTINSLETQKGITREMVENYKTLINAEERKFSVGESSLFLINSREKSLIDAELKQNELNIKFLESKAELFYTMGTNL
ncbi:TolC family protein [Galbibacter mesophilus]|uniref:TolC family protein n=1 Tax=Galbibacter mesophilus TaxID=379069 RepID=UPI00191D8398|nr:TolC family protein [Galbibacter mesophilus]MCM5664371.1 TolC family protein [Galbibacter mesophilus]